MDERFELMGLRPAPPTTPVTLEKRARPPLWAAIGLGVIVLGCLFGGLFTPRDPGYMDLMNAARAPCGAYPFGTDTLGRDMFAMLCSGGRTSLAIGLLAAAISTAIALIYGAAAGLGPGWLDRMLMRLGEIFLSMPSLLAVLLLQAAMGRASVLSIALAVGATGWMSMAKVVRTEVRRLAGSEYVLASRAMGGGFFHVLGCHLIPDLTPAVLFMAVMAVRGAILAESTLSFMGMGLPLEAVSWGGLLSQANSALTSGAWWIILIPGAFLVLTLLCLTELGNWLRRTGNKKESNL